jgi:hypothetical protein
MLLIVEGPDGGGKSSLVEVLKKQWPGMGSVHHGPYRDLSGQDIASIYMASMKRALVGDHIILDRCWLSEPIYAAVYRKTSSRLKSAHVRMLERAALAAGAVVIRCLPPVEACLRSFDSGREEMLDSEKQLLAVYGMYQLLPGLTAIPIIDWDYTHGTEKTLLDELAAIQLVEQRRSKVILLGDRPNVRTHAQEALQVPFVSFKGIGCSEWLAEQLEKGDIPEDCLRWLNAYTADGKPLDPKLLPEGPVIAMGKAAARWCSEKKVSCTLVPHPQAHKRFYSGVPYPLIEEIRRVVQKF